MERRNPPQKQDFWIVLSKSSFPNSLTCCLRVTLDLTLKKSTAEIIDSVSGKTKWVTPTCVGARKVYFQKPWNLTSHHDPVSAAVWCSNCTVMAFYVALLRWLIIYTLHTPSSCSSDFSKLMTDMMGNCSPRGANPFTLREEKYLKRTSNRGPEHGWDGPDVVQFKH